MWKHPPLMLMRKLDYSMRKTKRFIIANTTTVKKASA